VQRLKILVIRITLQIFWVHPNGVSVEFMVVKQLLGKFLILQLQFYTVIILCSLSFTTCFVLC
jgi:hypothetical protein